MATEKARYWTWVGYPESMIDNWEELIGDILQVPFAYCIHDKDLLDQDEEKRKPHVHVVVAYGNTTTMNSVRTLFAKLRKDQSKEKTYVKSVQNIKHMYKYLLHDTDSAKKQGKHVYDLEERITGNDFDIGMYVQLSSKEKEDMSYEPFLVLKQLQFTDFATFMDYVTANFGPEYYRIAREESGFFNRYIKGCFHRRYMEKCK